jgi:tetratricopeptide (TPR) repeat protein
MERQPLNPEPYLILMLISEQNGNPPLAQSYRDKLTNMGHNIHKILADRTVELCRAGETYLARRQYIDAEIFFWQALAINSNYIPALIDMGSLNAEREDFASAIQYFNKALTIDPHNAAAHFNLATMYKMQGRFADAQDEMAKFSEAEKTQQKKEIPGNSPH